MLTEDGKRLLLASEFPSSADTYVRNWCVLLVDLCQHLTTEILGASWDDTHRQWVADRAADWDSGLADRLKGDLVYVSNLRDPAANVLSECDANPDSLATLYVSLAAEQEARRAAESRQGAHATATDDAVEDVFAHLQDGAYHEFADGVYRVWTPAAHAFLSEEELAEWNVGAATDRVARAWAEVQRRLPPGTVLPPEVVERATRQLIERLSPVSRADAE